MARYKYEVVRKAPDITQPITLFTESLRPPIPQADELHKQAALGQNQARGSWNTGSTQLNPSHRAGAEEWLQVPAALPANIHFLQTRPNKLPVRPFPPVPSGETPPERLKDNSASSEHTIKFRLSAAGNPLARGKQEGTGNSALGIGSYPPGCVSH